MTRQELNTEIDSNIQTVVNQTTFGKVRYILKTITDFLEDRIDNISLTPGPAGPTGPQGAAGINGTNGTNGSNAQVPLVYKTQLYQSSTSNPSPNEVYDTFQINPSDNSQTLFRNIVFTRIGLGTYRVTITYKTSTTPTNFNKFSIDFGDGTVRIFPGYTNGGVGLFSYREYTFMTYTPDGILSDDQLTGCFVTATLYP